MTKKTNLPQEETKKRKKFVGGGKKNVMLLGVILLVLVVGSIFFMTKKDPYADCKKAVTRYLAEQTKKTPTDQVVVSGDNVVVDYIGRLADGEIFDTSVESVAISCGKYQTGRNYTTWLSFTVGVGQMIAGFDKGVQGMKVGETKTINIPSVEAYGPWDEEKIQEFPLKDVPAKEDWSAYKVGDALYTMMGPVKVVAISWDALRIDFNHPLAGKDLIFDLTVKEVKAPTAPIPEAMVGTGN